jgi:high affinity Mn2+ porin
MGRLAPAALVLSVAFVLHAQDATIDSQQVPADAPAQGGQIPRQQEHRVADRPEVPQKWNIFWQATSIGQYHSTFHSPYEGANSLEDVSERSVSLTTTLFLGMRLGQSTQIYVDPEVAGGRGFSNVTGIANFPNGELPRVSGATPKPYLARAFLQQDFGWGAERESFESEENQLAGDRPMNRYTVVAGRFTVTDYFDNNRYSHDPRTQFMGWAVMYNGAWDYPADTRGYTWGWVHELHTKFWSFRYGSAGEPKVANGLRFDRRIFRDRGDMFEVERRHSFGSHPGAVRALGFALHTDSGSYQEALNAAAKTRATPAVVSTRQVGRLKYGFGLNMEQELTADIGVFSRLGWNDGKTESFAFTAMDRLASGGVSVTGTHWRRHYDTVGSELSVGGLSRVHANYLAAGGLDFIIGDGRLNYGPEYVWESYYSARVVPGFFLSVDTQRIANPAYNQDRGPVWAYSLRLHIEAGK